MKEKKKKSDWIYITIDSQNFTKELLSHANNGYGDPTITNITHNGKSIPHSIALSPCREGPRQTIIAVQYLLKQYKSHGCSMHVKFSDQAVSFLRKTTRMGHSKNKDNSISQKEITGSLHVDKIEEKDGDYLFIIGCAESRIEHGSEEEVNVSPSRYNFHSHPEEAYIRHKVTKAWPSLTDYLGYLILGNNTIFHCVVSLEGIYVISFSQQWVGNLNKVNKTFIRKHYDIDYTSKLTPYQYMHKINHINYKGHPIFIIKYLPWNHAATTIFSVSYKKDGLNCKISDVQF